jgi:hypothetical protein
MTDMKVMVYSIVAVAVVYGRVGQDIGGTP